MIVIVLKSWYKHIRLLIPCPEMSLVKLTSSSLTLVLSSAHVPSVRKVQCKQNTTPLPEDRKWQPLGTAEPPLWISLSETKKKNLVILLYYRKIKTIKINSTIKLSIKWLWKILPTFYIKPMQTIFFSRSGQ